jgi:hypothetical protein
MECFMQKALGMISENMSMTKVNMVDERARDSAKLYQV